MSRGTAPSSKAPQRKTDRHQKHDRQQKPRDAAAFQALFIRFIRQTNGSTVQSLGDPVDHTKDANFWGSLQPQLSPPTLTATLLRLDNGNSTSPTVTLLGTTNSLWQITITSASGQLAAGITYLLRVVFIGATCEVEFSVT
jgi:hypothetical protein